MVEIKSDNVEDGLNKLLDKVKEVYGGEVKHIKGTKCEVVFSRIRGTLVPKAHSERQEMPLVGGLGCLEL